MVVVVVVEVEVVVGPLCSKDDDAQCNPEFRRPQARALQFVRDRGVLRSPRHAPVLEFVITHTHSQYIQNKVISCELLCIYKQRQNNPFVQTKWDFVWTRNRDLNAGKLPILCVCVYADLGAFFK